VAQGSAAAFSVTATGGSLSYQWKLNGVNVVGTSGTYTVVVSNSAGSLSSQPHLAVTATGTLTLTYYQSPASSALVVTPQTSFDLVNWSTAPPAVQIGTDPATGDSIMQVQIQAPQARQFLRLRVREP